MLVISFVSNVLCYKVYDSSVKIYQCKMLVMLNFGNVVCK